jgi:hypothetical protein
MNSLSLQLAELDADTREMLQMLRDTCVQETGVDEGMWYSHNWNFEASGKYKFHIM